MLQDLKEVRNYRTRILAYPSELCGNNGCYSTTAHLGWPAKPVGAIKLVTLNIGGRVDANASLGHIWNRIAPFALAVTETMLGPSASYSSNSQYFYAPAYRREGARRYSGGLCFPVRR